MAERLRAAREAAGLTQRDASTRAGLSNAYVSMVERSDDEQDDNVIRSPSARTLEKLARVLNVRVEWLAFGSGPMKAPTESGPGDLAKGSPDAELAQEAS